MRLFKKISLLTLGMILLIGAASAEVKKAAPPPPDIKIREFELKGFSSRGVLVDAEKDLEIKVTGNSKEKAAKGNIVLYNSEKTYEGKFKEISYTLALGKTQSWKFSDSSKINSINFNNLAGTAAVRIEQPKFLIPKTKVKKTTPDMVYQLNSAIVAGAYDVAKKMIAMGVDVNGQDDAGNTPLFMACRKAGPEFIEYLLDLGADPNIKNMQESTAIIAAASNRNYFAEIIPLLLDKEADVKVKAKDGTTVLWPLTFALVMGRSEEDVLATTVLVLSKGAEVDPEIEGGQTPLMLAAMHGKLEMVKLLVENGANVNAKTQEGQTPLNLAQENKHSEVASFLKASGAK